MSSIVLSYPGIKELNLGYECVFTPPRHTSMTLNTIMTLIDFSERNIYLAYFKEILRKRYLKDKYYSLYAL